MTEESLSGGQPKEKILRSAQDDSPAEKIPRFARNDNDVSPFPSQDNKRIRIPTGPLPLQAVTALFHCPRRSKENWI